jgi:hypothetical protein
MHVFDDQRFVEGLLLLRKELANLSGDDKESVEFLELLS